jgi:hypothetical protein
MSTQTLPRGSERDGFIEIMGSADHPAANRQPPEDDIEDHPKFVAARVHQARAYVRERGNDSVIRAGGEQHEMRSG